MARRNSADMIFHPVRMRMLLAFGGDRRFTAQELGQRLPDVPPATLYRHLNALARAGILLVAAERPVRGAIEKIYALPPQRGRIDPADFARASREEHMRYFATFVASLLGEYARYLEGDQANPLLDGVGYRQVPLYLNPEELRQFSLALNMVVLPALANGPAPGRRRRIFTTVVMPAPDEPAVVPPQEGESNAPGQ